MFNPYLDKQLETFKDISYTQSATEDRKKIEIMICNRIVGVIRLIIETFISLDYSHRNLRATSPVYEI